MATSTASASQQYKYASGGTYFRTTFHLQQPRTYIGAAAPPIAFVQIPSPAGVTPLYPAPALLYTFPQNQQAQQLFQKDAQIITPEALESVKAAIASSEFEQKAKIKKKAVPRKAAGQTWEDPTLQIGPRKIGNEVNDDVLSKHFQVSFFQHGKDAFPSAWEATICIKVVRDKRTGKTQGYGFVSFSNPSDLTAALKEMDGKYVGNRPIKLGKSNWKDRIDYEALERQKNRPQKKSEAPERSVLHK